MTKHIPRSDSSGHNTSTLSEPAVLNLARKMAEPGQVVTWLNHWSIGRASWPALDRIGAIGVDGTLLQILLRAYGYPLERTSADLVLPVFFGSVLAPGAKVAIIGAEPGVARNTAAKVEKAFGHQVRGFDGYDELRALREDPEALREFAPDVIVLGLGAGLQDDVALEMHEHFPQASICTAGGWIDQFAANEQYFPAWIHRFRLGWAWRIAHEPRRLIGRYTTDAAAFMVGHRSLLRKLQGLPHRATVTGFDNASRGAVA